MSKKDFDDFTLFGWNMRMVSVPVSILGKTIIIILNKEEKPEGRFEERISNKCMNIVNDPDTTIIRTISELYEIVNRSYEYFCDIANFFKTSRMFSGLYRKRKLINLFLN